MFVFKRTRGSPQPLYKKKKSKAAQDVLDRLNAFLNAAEPEPVYWLTRLWNDQKKAVTYAELREAVLTGAISEQTVADWQQSYANFVNEKLKPIWKDSMTIGAANLKEKYPGFFYNPMEQGARSWIKEHGAQWVTQISEEQRKAIAAMLDNAVTGKWTVDELALAIRPCIGLTKQQAAANLKYYQNVKEHLLQSNPGMKEATAAKKAQEAALKYADRQHRQRAYTIATTELAAAYNKGADEGIKQAIEQGYLGKMKRVWSTSGGSNVCPICAALDGMKIDMDGEFSFNGSGLGGGETPPAHPRCACAILYEEVEPPIFKPENNRTELRQEEEKALKDYISSESYRLNDALRRGTALTEEQQALVQNLDMALSKMPVYTGIVYRSLSNFGIDDTEKFIQQYRHGGYKKSPAYLSTGVFVYDEDMPIQYVIVSKTGRDIREFNESEGEILFRRNTMFKIVKVVENTIYLEEV